MCRCGGRCSGRFSLSELEEEVMDDLEANYGTEDVDEATRHVPPPPGVCTWERHNALQGRVRLACDQQRNCGPTMIGCGVLRQYGTRNVRCAQARNQINNECYLGGDATHRAEARRAAAAANRCRTRFRQRSCPRPNFFE